MAELRAPSADGTEITALDEGDGSALLVVPPGGGDATAWDQVVRVLRADLAAVLPDVRVVTLPRQGYFAHLMAPAALADVIREAAARVRW